jgi:formate hydrogenlyase subunit 3/multisubunit Na+/H+ antiporter MnhD subunit
MALALLGGVLSPALNARPAKQRYLLSMLLAASGIMAFLSGILSLTFPATGSIQLPIGLPWLPMHLKLDALSGFFMLTVGALLFPVGIYSVGYLKEISEKRGLGQFGLFLSLFVLGMQGVLLADDAYTFMIFWELMSVSSYFLVTFEDEDSATLRAGFLYLIMAHFAGMLIMGSFAVLYSAAGSFTFDAMTSAEISPGWASIAFLLAAGGFGMKSGIVPFHAWLPEAHPVAPSNVSALMSGIMLKVAIFGFLKVVWELMGVEEFQWWWGALVLAAGSGSAVSGVLLALQQHDLKRLLAYHSVENIGIIAIGLGLAMIFAAFGHPHMAALGLIAGLYHTINHALFKGLLFMGAGSVLHAAGTRNMERMGGLIHRMPVTSVLFLVACIAISALPPLNGFVSEWLTFQTALLAPQLEGTLLAALIPFSASMLALAGALAAACFVKVYGIVFLGRARSDSAARAHEVDGWMKTGMAIPAFFCLLLGVLPTFFIQLVDMVPQALVHVSLGDSINAGGWLWLTPVAPERASYAAPVVLFGMLALGCVIFLLLHPKGVRIIRRPIWSCGNSHMNPRMQYTATAFSQPLRRIFEGLYQPDEHENIQYGPNNFFVKTVRHEVHIRDLAFEYLYLPIVGATKAVAEWVALQHHRGIHAYLTYIFVTILALLVWITLR